MFLIQFNFIHFFCETVCRIFWDGVTFSFHMDIFLPYSTTGVVVGLGNAVKRMTGEWNIYTSKKGRTGPAKKLHAKLYKILHANGFGPDALSTDFRRRKFAEIRGRSHWPRFLPTSYFIPMPYIPILGHTQESFQWSYMKV